MKKYLVVGLLACICGVASADGAGDDTGLYWRPGYTHLLLSTKSEEVNLSGLNNVSQLALNEGPIAGSGVEIQGGGRPSVVMGYALNDRWSFETIIAPPFEFELDFTGTTRYESIAPVALDSIPTGIQPFGKTMGTVKSLPAVATLLYNLNRKGIFQPYVGLGVTYVYNFDPKVTNEVLLLNGDPYLEVSSEFGLMLQSGVNITARENLKINLDVKYGSGINLSGQIKDITLNAPTVSDLFGLAKAEQGSIDLVLDALVLNASVRWRF